MTSDSIDWTQEAELDPEKEYRALVRSIRYTRGFELLFVQCSPAEGNRLVKKVREDLPSKKIEVLTLEEAIDNLYDIVDALPNKDQIDALFIQGIERSLYEYEKEQLWDDSSDQRNYNQKKIPRLLGHLNLGRERFRDQFKFCFVFLVPQFVLKYLVRRAPDFFDWRSGVLEIPTSSELLNQETFQVFGSYKDHLSWTQQERDRMILGIQCWIDELQESPERKIQMLHKQGNLFYASKQYREAITSYDCALKVKQDNHEIWYNRGISLANLGRYEEAITSYDKALKHKSNYYEAWYNRGISLANLGRYEEAVASYDKALEIKSNNHNAWYYRGIALDELEHYKQADQSYDSAIQLQSNNYELLFRKALVLLRLSRYEEAISISDNVIQINPRDSKSWHQRGILLEFYARSKKSEVTKEILAGASKGIRLISNLVKQGSVQETQRSLITLLEEIQEQAEGAQYLVDKFAEAITCFDKALEIQPGNADLTYYQARCHTSIVLIEKSLLVFVEVLAQFCMSIESVEINLELFSTNIDDRINQAIFSLRQAIKFNSKYHETVKTNSDFDVIRNDDRFQALINEHQNE